MDKEAVGDKGMEHKRTKKRENSFSFERDIRRITSENLFYRRVVYTGPHSQLVLMSIPPGGETGEEKQKDTDEMLFIVKGKAKSILNKRARDATKYEVIFVPAGNLHNLESSGRHDVKIFVVYSPPLYADGTIHKTPEDSLAARTMQFAYAWEQ
jgi:mannose-6-phosphate isomerase-like protein (cupin superfamily)